MYKLLVNSPSGEQRFEYVAESGKYYDKTRVLWDERKTGEVGNITIGKMELRGDKLVELATYTAEHAAWLKSVEDKQSKELQQETESVAAKNDGDIAALRGMTNQQIDDWFASNVTTAAQLIKLVKKIIKVLIRKELI